MKPLRHDEIFGNWATLLLTTDRNGILEFGKLSDEIDTLIAAKPNGIYSNGTAGEFYAQTEEEFDKINQLLAEKCEKAGIAFQIGVSHMSPQISLERLWRIKYLKPGAVQVILPDWFPVVLQEVRLFLERMAEAAEGISLILYNPPHAKTILKSADWPELKRQIPTLVGVKVFDFPSDPDWYDNMRDHNHGLSVFVPGHRLATGIQKGAHGAYSNMACLNPFAAQRWYEQVNSDLAAALDLEKRINQFMDQFITPLITRDHFPNHACDRFLALLGGWADIGPKLRWPYRSIPESMTGPVRRAGAKIIPEFF